MDIDDGNEADLEDDCRPQDFDEVDDQRKRDGLRIMKRDNKELTISDFDADGRLVLYAACADFKAFSACINPFPIPTAAVIWAREAFERANEDIFPDEPPYYLDCDILKLVCSLELVAGHCQRPFRFCRGTHSSEDKL